MHTIMTNEGIMGFWRGNALSIGRATVAKGILFSTQDALSQRLGNDALAGAAAGVASGALSYPLDLLRTRLAATVGKASALSLLREALKERGVISLYRGAPATLVGAAAFEASRFGIYGALRDRVGSTHWVSSALCGMMASVAAGSLLYPNDTIRRRLQNSRGPFGTYLTALRGLLHEGGVRRLYRGIVLYNIKVAPAAAVQFALYSGFRHMHVSGAAANANSPGPDLSLKSKAGVARSPTAVIGELSGGLSSRRSGVSADPV